jgi:predicted dehydrogenase
MKQKIYTAAIIGTGRIGFSLGFDRRREQPASHTMALKGNRRISLIAGCDTDPERLAIWKRAIPAASVYEHYADLFASHVPDIVVISVNENAHLETALAAIRAHPRLLILEKPVALTVHDGLFIRDAALEHNVPVLVNHERRFAADYKTAYSYMGNIGSIQSITAVLSSGLRVYCPKDEETGEYSLLHDGTHLADIVLYLLKAVSCDNSGNLLCNPVLTGVFCDPDDPSVIRNISAHYETGVCPDITLSISGRSRYFGFEVDIRGTTGRIYIGNGFARFYRREESRLYTGFYSLEKDRSVKLPGKTGYFANMIQNAVDFLDGKAPLVSTLQDGLNALSVLEEIRKELKIRMDAGNLR